MFVSTLHFTLERLYQRDIYRIYESSVARINQSNIAGQDLRMSFEET
jgi:hypothetical protein